MSDLLFSYFFFDCDRLSDMLILLQMSHWGDVRLALAELADSLQGTFFRDYPLDLEILDFLLEDISFDWYGLMWDAIAPALLTAPHLSSGFVSRRCEELLRAYHDDIFLFSRRLLLSFRSLGRAGHIE
jgi:hypothetical protein